MYTVEIEQLFNQLIQVLESRNLYLDGKTFSLEDEKVIVYDENGLVELQTRDAQSFYDEYPDVFQILVK